MVQTIEIQLLIVFAEAIGLMFINKKWVFPLAIASIITIILFFLT